MIMMITIATMTIIVVIRKRNTMNDNNNKNDIIISLVKGGLGAGMDRVAHRAPRVLTWRARVGDEVLAILFGKCVISVAPKRVSENG